jgi:hypothetical protein
MNSNHNKQLTNKKNNQLIDSKLNSNEPLISML